MVKKAEKPKKAITEKETQIDLPENSIEVRIDDFERGLRVYDDVRLARIKSSDYNIIIMADHMPIIGEMNGSLELVQSDKIETITDVHAFYMHRNNVLSLLIKEYFV